MDVRKVLLSFFLSVAITVTMIPMGVFGVEFDGTDTVSAQNEAVDQDADPDVPEVTDITVETDDEAPDDEEDDPVISDQPEQPDQSSQPEQPEQPTQPEQPEQPTQPAKEKKSVQKNRDASYVIDVSGIADQNEFNKDIDLLDGVKVRKDGEVDTTASVSVVSATPSNPHSQFDSSQDYNPETSILNAKDVDSNERKRGQVTYTIVYEAYVDGAKVAENSKSILIFNNSSGDIVDEDVAYLSKEFSRLKDTIDGTAEFDAEDGPGYDSGPRNKIVRTFDTVTDKVEIYNDVYEGMDFTTYEKGYVGFEFVLKGTSKQVEFATDAMNWLDVKQADYATFEVEKDGKTYQVMRGRFLWESEDNTQPAISAASQELGLAYTVLAMCNNETVQPYYTFWMEYNDVPQSDVAIGDFPTDNYIFVKDYSGACAIHGEKEPITIEGGQVKVSAAPWYNAQLKEAKPSSTRAAGYWDLKTGEYSVDEETDTSIYGRSFCYGLTIQIRRPDGNGIKGCELPDGSDITIKLKLSELKLVGKSGTVYNSEGFDPVLWSVEGNKNGNTQADGRQLPASIEKYAVTAAPFNSGWTNRTVAYCHDGGTWQGNQNGKVVSFTISDYEVDIDKIPRSDAGATSYTYLPPDRRDRFDMYAACFSAGEIWFVSPFYQYDISGEGESVSVVKGESAIDRMNGESGTVQFTIQDGMMSVTSMSGQSVPFANPENPDPADNSNQNNPVKQDDKLTGRIDLVASGEIEFYSVYQKYRKSLVNPQTDGCSRNGQDWVLAGGNLDCVAYTNIKQGDLDRIYMAADILLKFDNDFFEIEEGRIYNEHPDEMNSRVLYAAKRDKSGWDHYGQDPEGELYDKQMKETEADNLVYFSSLEALENAGYTCVGVLGEFRQGTEFANNISLNFFLVADGKAIYDTDNFNKVFMISHEGHAWTRDKLTAEIREYYDTAEPSEQQITEYMNNVFPSKLKAGEGDCYTYDNYTEQTADKRPSTDAGLIDYVKTQYDADGTPYDPSPSYPHFGDSVLVIGYITGIAIDCAQAKTSGGEKETYDMDTGQRVVDYVIHPRIEANGRSNSDSGGGSEPYTTTVTIETTLPAKLHYIPDSSYQGGTYEQTGEGRQGSVSGGKLLDTIVTENPDGTTTLKYVFEVTVDWDQITGDIADLEPIYFSCDIGEAGTDNDVQDGDQLMVTTTIESTEDNIRPKDSKNGNSAYQTIRISKLASVSLVDRADHVAVDAKDKVGFTSTVVNESNNDRPSALIVHVPMNGYNNTHYTGERTITEFSVPAGYEVWYTTDTGSYERDDYSAGEINEGNGWHILTVGEDGKVDLSGTDTTDIAAFAVIGTIPGNGRLETYTLLSVPDDKAGDFFQHSVSLDGMSNYARTYVVQRSIRGLAWVDKNEDGLQDQEEMTDSAVAPITVTLLKLSDAAGADPSDIGDYNVFTYGSGSEATVQLGKSLDLNSGELSSMSDYHYDFTNMPEGTYALRFNNDDETIANRYHVTKKDANDNANDDIDSDAEYVATRSTSVWGVVDGSFITGIELPATDDITTSHYITRNHDLGIATVKVDLEFKKKVEKLEESTTDPDANKEFTFLVMTGESASALSPYVGTYTLTTATDDQTDETTTDGKIILKDGETALIADLEMGAAYKITEEIPETADGFIYAQGKTGTLTGNLTGDDALIFINKYKTVELPVSKTWVNYEGADNFEATVTLSAKVDGDAYTLPEGITTTHSFVSANTEDTYTFEGLPASTPAGKEISYSVSETAITSETAAVSKEADDDAFYIFSTTEEELSGGGTAYRILGKWVPTETSADGAVTIVNTWTPATTVEEGVTGFRILKVDEEGNLITTDTAQFKVEKKGEDESLEEVGTFETIEGVATVTGLTEGEYVISEVKAPEGYTAAEGTFEITIDKDLKLKEVDKAGLKNILARLYRFLTGQSDEYSWDGENLELSVTNIEEPDDPEEPGEPGNPEDPDDPDDPDNPGDPDDPDNPGDPDDSDNPDNPGDSESSGNDTRTGDSASPFIYLLVMTASGLLLVTLLYRRRRN